MIAEGQQKVKGKPALFQAYSMFKCILSNLPERHLFPSFAALNLLPPCGWLRLNIAAEKEPPPLRTVVCGSIAMKGAYSGSCIGIVGRNTTTGMSHDAFAHFPQIRPCQGRSAKFGPICSGARRPSAGRAGSLPGPANTAPQRMQAELNRCFPISPPLCGVFS